MRRKICGIYCISNDYFFYIGQSVDIYKRWTVQKDMGGQVIKIWDSQSEASKVLGIRQGDIANILAGRQRSTRGFKFEYYNEK